jgi:16S rRNA (cytosine967-C5)-methyltransferase
VTTSPSNRRRPSAERRPSRDSRPSGNRAGRRGGAPTGEQPSGVAARRLAIEALVRIDTEGAYANLVVPALLGRSELDERDRGFVTELVYGSTRMRRACDWLVDRYLLRDLDAPTRATLRIGAYQLVFLETPPHAAVSATVAAAPSRSGGLVNAVLRKVASGPREWPDEATGLSYPDWMIDRLRAELGPDQARFALDSMNERATSVERADGYHQDLASQWAAAEVGAEAGERVLDLCAAPGGKATALLATGARVVAADLRPARVGLIKANAARLGGDSLSALAADGRRPPFRPDSFDRVLVDAPCSGLGSLRRRPDARWRIQPTDVDELATLQRDLLEAGAALVRPGGTLVYSVCTLTTAETIAVDQWLASTQPDFEAVLPPGAPWQPHGRGGLLLPQPGDAPTGPTDGMFLLRLTRR